jgi:hypothetical protein
MVFKAIVYTSQINQSADRVCLAGVDNGTICKHTSKIRNRSALEHLHQFAYGDCTHMEISDLKDDERSTRSFGHRDRWRYA